VSIKLGDDSGAHVGGFTTGGGVNFEKYRLFENWWGDLIFVFNLVDNIF